MFLATSRFSTFSALVFSATSSFAIPVATRSSLDEPEPELFRRAGDCFKLTADRAPRIPGWEKVVAYRDEHWGSKYVAGLQTNPPEYLNRPALVCLKSTEAVSRWEGEPICSQETMDVAGGATGVDVGINGGKEATRESKVSWTVMKSSEFSVGTEFTVGIGSEETGKAEAKFHMTTTLKDEVTNSTETTTTSKEFINYNFENKAGQDCTAKLKMTTCTGKARASLPVVVTGYVWFMYDKAVPDKTKPGSSKHYHWSVNLEKVLSEQERTRTIELSGSVLTTTRGDYAAECKDKPSKQSISGKTLSAQKPLVKKKRSTGPRAHRKPKTLARTSRAGRLSKPSQEEN